MKNQRLRDVLSKMGYKTVNVTTGNTRTEEIRDVEHFSSTVYQPLKESSVNKERVLNKTVVRQDQSGSDVKRLSQHFSQHKSFSKSPAPVRNTQYTTTTTQISKVQNSQPTRPVTQKFTNNSNTHTSTVIKKESYGRTGSQLQKGQSYESYGRNESGVQK